MNKPQFLVLCFVVVALACYLGYRHIANARALLQELADANDQAPARTSRLRHAMGMWFSTSKYQVVYHVAVHDRSVKRVRSAWLRLGTYWTGSMNGDAIEVKWEHEDRTESAHSGDARWP